MPLRERTCTRTLGAALHEGSAFLEKGTRDLCEFLGDISKDFDASQRNRTDLDLIRHFTSKVLDFQKLRKV